jgi:hypothetical protein
VSRPGPLVDVARRLERAAVSYAVIGAHAVNAWVEPRVTADIDVTAEVSASDASRLARVFEEDGFTCGHGHGDAQASGPDFMRLVSADGLVVVEVQVAKTAYQRRVIERAVVSECGVRIATAEDLVVLKLIADRPKDRADLAALAALPDLDWGYVERWAAEWQVADRLLRLRRGG